MSSIDVNPLSVQSLHLCLKVEGLKLATATGFALRLDTGDYLITNWHVLNGRHPATGKPLDEKNLGIPDELVIMHNSSAGIGLWERASVKLYENGNRCWLEHPAGPEVDVVALPLIDLNPSIILYPFNLDLAEGDLRPEPGMNISIIGFPLEYGSEGIDGSYAIWKTGHIASEPNANYQNKPMFLIDATTSRGMSGSPVVLRMIEGLRTHSGVFEFAPAPETKFLGVYSSRMYPDHAEIGMVWKPSVLTEIIDSQ